MNTDDYETILLLAGGCSLATSPGDKDNWIERTGPGGRGGGLPNYICKIARAIMRGGKTRSAAIAIAVSRVKKWAAGGDDVDADTRAKAAKAVAQWTALKAKNKAKEVVSASYITSDGEEASYLLLTYIPSFKTDIVRMAWDSLERARRDQWAKDHPVQHTSASIGPSEATADFYPYRWIKELWTDFILVEVETSEGMRLEKVPYTVHPVSKEVTFGDSIEVQALYVEVETELSESEEALLSDII